MDVEKVKSNLQAQLYELEMLQSMFSNPGELKFDDEFALEDMEKYIDGRSPVLPPFFEFTVNLDVNGTKFEVSVNLSHEYPAVEPDVFIRSAELGRREHTELNRACSSHVAGLERGEGCVYGLISWLQDNADSYKAVANAEIVEQSTVARKQGRFWIYSHHIYSKTKRREILYSAGLLKLGGFCMPGKPGVVCVEGELECCNEWWQAVKSMTWKRIVCKFIEEGDDDEEFRKFRTFEEVAFQNSGSRSNHMDIGDLYRYLEERKLGYAFKELFGVEGKSV